MSKQVVEGFGILSLRGQSKMRRHILGMAFSALLIASPLAAQQAEQTVYSSYKVLADDLRDRRTHGVDEPREQVAHALGLLDNFVLARLNASPPATGEEINAGLKRFLGSERPYGEDYTLQVFPGTSPAVYALAANLGFSGPAAVRVYESKAGAYKLTANIDQFTDPDFDDSYLKSLLFSPSAGELFLLTVSGRTDSWSTGTFTLWAIASGEVRKAWVAEGLAFSSYEFSGSELRLEFCEQVDDENPEVCRQRVRERYGLVNGEFRRLEHAPLPGATKK